MKKRLTEIALLSITIAIIGGCSLIEKQDNNNPSLSNNNSGKFEVMNPPTSAEDENTATSTDELIGTTTSSEEISDEEAFNKSGRAKAIERETDLWQFYDNPEVGISFNYPHSVTMLAENEYNIEKDKTYIRVDIKDIGKKENPLELSNEDEMKTIEVLHSGEFGKNYDFPLEKSKNVRSVGFLFAQDFLTLSRFEICNVTLERKLAFYFNNKRILITLYGPVDILKKTMPEYFTADKENCADELIWNFDKQDDFYDSLVNKQGSEEVNQWFGDFDKIAETVIFAHR